EAHLVPGLRASVHPSRVVKLTLSCCRARLPAGAGCPLEARLREGLSLRIGKAGYMWGLIRTLLAFTWLFVLPVAAFAQASIAGVVKDASGAVLPGVTVEAA